VIPMLASGVPLTRSDMSAVALLIMALVVVLSLAVGLAVVFLAARTPRRRERPGQQELAQPAAQTPSSANVKLPAPRDSAPDTRPAERATAGSGGRPLCNGYAPAAGSPTGEPPSA